MPKQVKASFCFMICSFLQKAVSVITTPIFTRLLSTAEYGKYSVFSSWKSIIEIFATLCLFYGVYSQGLVKFSDKKKEYSSSLMGLCTTLILIWFTIYILFHNFWNELIGLTTFQVVLMFVIIWANAVFTFWLVYQRFEYNYIQAVTVSLLVSICSPVISIILIKNWNGNKADARILGMAIAQLCAYGWMFIYQLKQGKSFFNAKVWKYALIFNLPLLPHYITGAVLSGADRIMIEDMIGSSEAGIYSLAYQVSMMLVLFNSSITQSLEPWILTKIKEKKIDNISKIIYPILYALMAIGLTYIIVCPELVKMFAPSTYYEAIYTIPPIALSVLFLFIYEVVSLVEIYYEKRFFITLASIIAAFLNIILNYVCILKFGYIAAAYTTLFCYLLRALMHYLMMKKICANELQGKQMIYLKDIGISIIVYILLGLIIQTLYDYIYVRYGILLLIIILVFAFRKKLIRFVKEYKQTLKSNE